MEQKTARARFGAQVGLGDLGVFFLQQSCMEDLAVLAALPAHCSTCKPGKAGSAARTADRKSTRLNSSHSQISYAVFCLKKKKRQAPTHQAIVTPHGSAASVLHAN